MLELEVKEQDQSYLNLVYFPIKAYTSPWLHSLRKGSVHAWLMLFTHSGVACVFDLKAQSLRASTTFAYYAVASNNTRV